MHTKGAKIGGSGEVPSGEIAWNYPEMEKPGANKAAPGLPGKGIFGFNP